MIHEVKSLREQEIVEFLREDLNFELYDNRAFFRPDPTFVIDVLTTCAAKCLDIKREDLEMVDFLSLTKISNESHTDAIQFFNQFYCIQELMDLLEIEDFSLVDIIDPQPKRIKYLLSIIISYIQLKDREEENNREKILKNKELEEKIQAKKSQFEKEKADHDELSEKKNKEMPTIEKLKEEIEFVNSDIRLNNELLTDVQKAEEGILQERNTLDKQINELNDKIDLIKYDIEHLQKKVVKSPEKIINTLTDVNNQIKTEKEAVAGLDEEINKLSLQFDIYTLLYQTLEECFKMMDDIKTGINNEKATKKKLKDGQRDTTQLKYQLDEKQKAFPDVLKSIKTNEERVENLEAQIQKRIEQINSMIAQLQKEKGNLQEETDKAIASVKAIEKMNVDTENQMKEKVRHNEQLFKDAAEVYDEVFATLQGLHNDLSYLFEAFKPKPGLP